MHVRKVQKTTVSADIDYMYIQGFKISQYPLIICLKCYDFFSFLSQVEIPAGILSPFYSRKEISNLSLTEAQKRGRIPDLSRGHGIAGDEELGKYRIQVPFEGFALKRLPQLFSAGHVPKVAQVVADPLVVVLLQAQH